MKMCKKLKENKSLAGTLFFLVSFSCFFIKTGFIAIDFLVHSLAMVPLAFMLGELTSNLSEYIGEKKGGLLTATLGNLPEIIMGLWSIKLGLIEMVQAALIGSIVNNILLVLGLSALLGGVKFKQQKFKKGIARTNFNMLLLAMSSMVIMACINYYAKIPNKILVNISVLVSAILIIVYVLGLIFSLYTHSNLFMDSVESSYEKENYTIVEYRKKNITNLFIKIIIITSAIYFLSEIVINNANEIIVKYNVSQSFMGIILIPILGNIGENISAILCAMKNKVNLSLEIAIGSSIQIALFATPVLIMTAFILGVQMFLVFSVLHIIIIAVAIFMSYIVFADGNTYWFEGVLLIAVYIIITICYFYV